MGKPRATVFLVALLLSFAANACTKPRGPLKDDANSPPFLEIHLRDLGYKPTPEYHYPGTGIPRDLTTLDDDDTKRLAFVDDKTLVVYFSHLPPPSEANTRSMEALFIDANSGALISRKTWATHKRRWLNERWDTEARILPVDGGFLVHAGGSLVLYSTNQKEKVRLSLDDTFRWAAVVPPLGRTIHLQRIHDNNKADGEWFASDTLGKLHGQPEMAGVTSASEQAVVNPLAHCLQIQVLGDAPRDLCCDSQCPLGLPVFLTNDEIVSAYPNGFGVISTTGEKIWGREVPVTKTSIVMGSTTSLAGNRFAILVLSDHSVVFDGVKVSEGQPTLIIYDRSNRSRVFTLAMESMVRGVSTFALSQDGTQLALLTGDTIRIYKIPS